MLKVSTATLASGLRLSYASQGPETGPTAVLLPGTTDSWRSYGPMLGELPPWLRAVAVSPRGHGDSDKPEGGYAIEDFAADAVDLLRVLDIERAVVVGHSSSCLVARRVALDQPGRVAGLVLEASPVTFRANDRLRAFVESVTATLTDPIDPAFVRSFVSGTSSEHVDPAWVDVFVEEVLKVPARVWHAVFSRLLEYDDTDELPMIGARALLIWGEADAIVSREAQELLVERLPAAELVVYPAVGHTPRWDDPRRFADDLATFVERAL